jgi:hypothetical protein
MSKKVSSLAEPPSLYHDYTSVSDEQALQEFRVKAQGMDDRAYLGFTLVLTRIIDSEEQKISQ